MVDILEAWYCSNRGLCATGNFLFCPPETNNETFSVYRLSFVLEPLNYYDKITTDDTVHFNELNSYHQFVKI